MQVETGYLSVAYLFTMVHGCSMIAYLRGCSVLYVKMCCVEMRTTVPYRFKYLGHK